MNTWNNHDGHRRLVHPGRRRLDGVPARCSYSTMTGIAVACTMPFDIGLRAVIPCLVGNLATPDQP
jgi:hypothetical protein